MPAILSRLSLFYIKYISRDLDNTEILLYKLFVRLDNHSRFQLQKLFEILQYRKKYQEAAIFERIKFFNFKPIISACCL